MHALLDNDWDLTDIAHVDFRKVGFDQDGAQITVTAALRHAWIHLPPTPDDDNVDKFMREDVARTDEDRAALPTNPDTENLHTPWRNKVCYMFNHLFYDVANFMSSMYGVGHLHPPNSDVVGVKFPGVGSEEGGENERVLTKVWETEVLLVPAFLAPGVTVRMETYGKGEEDGVMKDIVKLRGKFHTENPWEIWYIGKGVESRFYIEGEWKREGEKLAAVLAYGILDRDCSHRRAQEEEEE